MIVVSRSVYIAAPIEHVFGFMANAAARARLNPHAKVVRVDVDGDGALRTGAVCRFVMRHGGRTIDYRMRVREFRPNALIVSESEGEVPFTVRIETQPEGSGTRVTQTESFEPTDAMLQEALPDSESHSLMRTVYRVFMFMDADAAMRLRARQEQELRQMLERRLDDWLGAIKRAVEAAQAD